MRFLYFTVGSSFLIILVLLIRTFLRRQLSPAAIYALWLIPAVRLLVPFSYIDVSGFNAPYEWFQQGVAYIADGGWGLESGNTPNSVPDGNQPENMESTDMPVSDMIPAGTYGSVLQTAETSGESVPETALGSRAEAGFDGLTRTEQICLLLWLCGSIVVGSYALLSNRRLGRTVRHMDMDRRDSPLPVCLSNAVVAPCLFGLFRPRILLSWKVKENPKLYHQVLRHELAHYRQKDHIWTFLRILLCVVYWWNPFVWAGAVCSREDAELACDQRVTRDLDTKGKREYGLALLLLLQQTWNQPTILYSATSVHGQGKSLKRRIENITKNRKTKKWVLLPVCLLLSVSLLAGCSMPSDQSGTETEQGQPTENPEEAALEISETAGEEEQTKSEQLAHTWAEAFCGRDGEIIYGLASEEARQKMQDEMLMEVLSDGSISFGWSSPWPGMFTEESYRILFVDEYGAEILYYAGVSDPHLTVWREQLTFAREDEKLVVASSKIQFLDDISTSEEFFQAYPGGEITGTVMDYAANKLGTYLNDHAMERTDMEVYQLLKDPKLAVCSLLNLGRPWNEDTEGEPRKVDISLKETDGRTIARITFLEDGGTAEVQMVQPYGEDGIWVPETAYVPWSATDPESSEASDTASESTARDDWQPAELTYAVPGWAEAYQSEISAEIREADAQKALEELYELTGYQVKSCVYTSTNNGGYCFAKSEDDMEHSRIFYSRYFKDEGYEKSIPSMGITSARRVWYSDVQQLLVPENADQMTNGEMAVWFLQRSGVYQGERIAGTGLVFETDPQLIKVTMEDGTFYEVQVDREIQAVYSIYGPYPKGSEH